MLWTLIGFIASLAALIVYFLNKVIKTITINYLVYPSNANIDQVLPVEIMEQVMTLLDPLALMECRHVSKYWRYHATKSHIEKEVMDEYERKMKSINLSPKMENFNKTQDLWLNQSDPKYPRSLLLRDRALACKIGKQMLEFETKSLKAVLENFRHEPNGEYIIKTIGNRGHGSNIYFDNIDGQYSDIFCNRESLEFLPGLDWDSIPQYRPVDVMFDLSDALDEEKQRKGEQRVYSVRQRHPTRYFGFVPLDKHILLVIALIFAPLVVHDLLNSAYLSFMKQWFGPLVFLVTSVVNLILIKAFSTRHSPRVYVISSFVFMIGFLLLSGLTLPYSTNYFATLGMCGLALLYVVLVLEYTFPWHSKPSLRRSIPGIIGLVAVILMNDWKLTADSIKNGVIFWRLFDNTVFYAVFCLYEISLNFLANVGSGHALQWHYLIDWQKDIVRTTMICYGLVVFITLYGPTWQGNHL